MNPSQKVAIVTGAGGAGSGRAVARRLAREGAVVVVADVNQEGGLETVSAIKANGASAVFVQTDVGHEDEVRDLVAAAEEQFGGVDILVNNASGARFPESALEHWFLNLQVDLLGAMYATRYALESMRKRKGGAIVNIGSISALVHGGRVSKAPGYDTAKAGILRLTTCLGHLREGEGVRINCLVPGWIASPPVKAYWDSLTPEQRDAMNVPSVLISPEEIAGVALRLIADESLGGRVLVWLNGQRPRLIPAGDPGYAALEEW